MRLLLSGAGGFTGIHLAQAARDRGYAVTALEGDLQDKASVAEQVAQIQPTHVIHLAGISQVTGKDELAYYSVNVLGSLNLLHALTALDTVPQKVILASSANVYGNNPHSPIVESEPPGPISHYAMSKLAVEYLSKPFVDRLPIVIARPFNYTGVGHADHFVIPKIIAHVRSQAKLIELGNIDVLREYNDVRDICALYLRLLTHGEVGNTYNLASGRVHSLREVLAAVECISQHSMVVEINPHFLRANEITRLCGDVTRLEHALGPLAFRPLNETLGWMLFHDLRDKKI